MIKSSPTLYACVLTLALISNPLLADDSPSDLPQAALTIGAQAGDGEAGGAQRRIDRAAETQRDCAIL